MWKAIWEHSSIAKDSFLCISGAYKQLILWHYESEQWQNTLDNCYWAVYTILLILLWFISITSSKSSAVVETMFSNLGSAAAPDMADYYLSMLTHLRNHTEVLRNMDRETGLHHESVLSLLNVTQEDLEFMFNTNRIQEQRAPCYCSGPLQEVSNPNHSQSFYLDFLVS